MGKFGGDFFLDLFGIMCIINGPHIFRGWLLPWVRAGQPIFISVFNQ